MYEANDPGSNAMAKACIGEEMMYVSLVRIKRRAALPDSQREHTDGVKHGDHYHAQRE